MFFETDGIGLEILDVFIIKRPRTSRTFTKDRDFSVLSKRISGTARMVQDDTEIELDPSKLLFIPKYAAYSQITEGETVMAIHLNLVGTDFSKIETAPAPDGCDEVLKRIYALWTAKEKSYKYRAEMLLLKILSGLLAERDTAERYVEKRLSDPTLSVKDIASHFYVSEQYFRRDFKKRFGTSPNRYINERRMAMAKKLLILDYHSVNEIAAMTGFADPAYFSTAFKKSVGMTPTEFKRLVFTKDTQI